MKARIPKGCFSFLLYSFGVYCALAQSDPVETVKLRLKEIGHAQPMTYQTNQRAGTIDCRIECRDIDDLNAVWEAMRADPYKVRISQGATHVTVVVHLPEQHLNEAASTKPTDQAQQPQQESGSATAKNYTVALATVIGVRTCDVVFQKLPLPPPDVVDKIVRSELEAEVLKDSSHGIVAMAFLGDDALDETQYSGAMHYNVKTKSIMTDDEYCGTKIVREDRGAYYIESKEYTTAEGTKTERKWITISLVFAKAPPVQEACDVAVAEAERASGRGLDVSVWMKVGDRLIPTSWRGLPDSNGKYFSVDYNSERKTIERENKILKRLP